MKCPLLEMAFMRTKVGEKGRGPDCLEAKCAWWDPDKNACSIRTIAKELTNIQLKMPTGE